MRLGTALFPSLSLVTIPVRASLPINVCRFSFVINIRFRVQFNQSVSKRMLRSCKRVVIRNDLKELFREPKLLQKVECK